jgi:hypothetical protein
MKPLASEADFDRVFLEAEMQRSNGDFGLSFSAYRSLLLFRLERVRQGGTFSSADMIVIERLADLATLFNFTSVADDLLHGLAKLFEEEGNKYAYVYSTIKRVNLALNPGDIDTARTICEGLIPYIGTLEDIPLHDLESWENFAFLHAEQKRSRKALLCQLYWVLGAILALRGQYTSALLCNERMLAHTQSMRGSLSEYYNVSFG